MPNHNFLSDLLLLTKYVQGHSAKALQEYMEDYRWNLPRLEEIYHRRKYEELSFLEQANWKIFLSNLGIHEKNMNKYLDLDKNIYQLLVQLSQDGFEQISFFLELIDEKGRKRRAAKVLGSGLAIGGIGAGLLWIPELSAALKLVMDFFSCGDALPVLGLIKTSLMAMFFTYRICSDVKQPLRHRVRDLSFVILNAIVNYTGYTLWLLSTAAMTPVVAGLFVISSLLSVLKDIVSVILEKQSYKRTKAQYSIPKDVSEAKSVDGKYYLENDLDPTLVDRRHYFSHRKHLNSIVINMATTLAVVGVMGVWTFVPGGIVVVMACIAALTLLYGFNHWAIQKNETRMRDSLQIALQTERKKYEEGVGKKNVPYSLFYTNSLPKTDSILEIKEDHYNQLFPENRLAHTRQPPAAQGACKWLSSCCFFLSACLPKPKGVRTELERSPEERRLLADPSYADLI